MNFMIDMEKESSSSESSEDNGHRNSFIGSDSDEKGNNRPGELHKSFKDHNSFDNDEVVAGSSRGGVAIQGEHVTAREFELII